MITYLQTLIFIKFIFANMKTVKIITKINFRYMSSLRIKFYYIYPFQEFFQQLTIQTTKSELSHSCSNCNNQGKQNIQYFLNSITNKYFECKTDIVCSNIHCRRCWKVKAGAQPGFFKGGVRLCQSEGTHQIVMSTPTPVVGCLRGHRHLRIPPSYALQSK